MASQTQRSKASPPDNNTMDLVQKPSETPSLAEKPIAEISKPNASRGSTVGSTILRDYRTHFDPLNTSDMTAMGDEDNKRVLSGPTAALEKADGNLQEAVRPLASSPQRPLQSAKSFLASTSITSHRSMLRTLASRTSQESLRHDRKKQDLTTNPRAPFAARFLHTPCFFHQRFDDAVNVDRVLQEIAADDDGMSHSRLMQTATSVREIAKQLQRRPIKRAVRTIMIVTKARDNRLVLLTRELTQWLLSTPRYNSDLGITVYVDVKLRTSKRFDAPSLIASDPRYESMLHYWTPEICMNSPDKFDLVLTLGGDGTVLYTSWLFQRIVPPILSFSLGTLGFLTNFAFGDYKPTLDRIMEGSGMRVNMRMRFACTVYRARSNHARKTSGASSATFSSRQSISSVSSSTIAGTPTSATVPSSATTPPSSISSPSDLIPESTFEVLNELVLDRGPSPYVSNLELYGDTHLLTIIQADGIIISTPTGSTAYSLSAGGPLTHPSIPGILLTPICPHTLSFRPMVLSDTLMLRLVVPKHSRGGAYASFDGKGRVELRRGDEVRVEVGRYPFPTVVGEGGTGGEWFDSVRRALRWNTRGAVQGGFGSRVNGGIAFDEAEEGKAAMTTHTKHRDADILPSDLEHDDLDNEVLEQDDEEEEEWDIDADPFHDIEAGSGAESAPGAVSDAGSVPASGHASPLRRGNSGWGLD